MCAPCFKFVFRFVAFFGSFKRYFQKHQCDISYRSMYLRFAAYSFAVLCSLTVNLLHIFWGRRSFKDPICCSFLHGFVHVSKVGFVHVSKVGFVHHIFSS